MAKLPADVKRWLDDVGLTERDLERSSAAGDSLQAAARRGEAAASCPACGSPGRMNIDGRDWDFKSECGFTAAGRLSSRSMN